MEIRSENYKKWKFFLDARVLFACKWRRKLYIKNHFRSTWWHVRCRFSWINIQGKTYFQFWFAVGNRAWAYLRKKYSREEPWTEERTRPMTQRTSFNCSHDLLSISQSDITRRAYCRCLNIPVDRSFSCLELLVMKRKIEPMTKNRAFYTY